MRRARKQANETSRRPRDPQIIAGIHPYVHMRPRSHALITHAIPQCCPHAVTCTSGPHSSSQRGTPRLAYASMYLTYSAAADGDARDQYYATKAATMNSDAISLIKHFQGHVVTSPDQVVAQLASIFADHGAVCCLYLLRRSSRLMLPRHLMLMLLNSRLLLLLPLLSPPHPRTAVAAHHPLCPGAHRQAVLNFFFTPCPLCPCRFAPASWCPSSAYLTYGPSPSPAPGAH